MPNTPLAIKTLAFLLALGAFLKIHGENEIRFLPSDNFEEQFSNTIDTTICSGTVLSNFLLGSSVGGDFIEWAAVVNGGISGIDTLTGNGMAPLELPSWSISNEISLVQFVNISVVVEDSLVEFIHIEVLPEIDIYLGPPAVPDTICSGDHFFAVVNSSVHNVEVAWTVDDQASQVSGGQPGQGPYINDLLVNPSNEVESLTYTFFTPNTQCPADPLIYEVEVIPPFSLPEIDEQTLCPGEELDLANLLPENDEYGYSWVVDNPDLGLDNGSGALPLITAESPEAEEEALVLITASWGGCPAETSFELIVHPQPVFNITSEQDTLCSGESLSVDIAVNSAEEDIDWQWTSMGVLGASQGTAVSPLILTDQLQNAGSELDSVVYTFSTPSAICPAEPLVWVVDVAPSLEMATVEDFYSCPGDSLMLPDYELAIEDAMYSWEIQGSDIGLAASGDSILDGFMVQNDSDSSAANATVVLIAEAFDCESTSSFNVTVHAIPTIELVSSDSLVCSGVPIDIQLETSLEDSELIWDFVAPDSVSGASIGQGFVVQDTLINEGSLTAEVLYEFTSLGSNCPADTISQTVFILPSIELPPLSDLAFCPGDTVAIDGLEIGTSEIEIAWSNSNEAIGLELTGMGPIDHFVAENDSNESIESVIQISAEIANCEPFIAGFSITVNPVPQVDSNVGPNGGLDCQTGIAVLEGFSASGSGTFSWDGPSVMYVDGAYAEVDESGEYLMGFIQGETGCETEIPVSVNEATPISVVWSPYDSLLCYGATTGELSVEADGGSEFLYNWIPPISIDSMATDLSDGIYEVWVQNESNCIDSLVAEIAEIPAIEVSIVDEGLALCGVSNGYIEVSASGGMGNLDLDWQIDTGPLLWAVESGPYHLHIEDDFGCTWDSTLTVQCLDEIPVGVNQLITPNGDGLNDVLFLEDLYLYPNHMLTVYNRWGKKVYQASPYENDWGGERLENESNPLPSSTYFYLLETGMDEPAFFRGFLEIHTDIR